MRTMWLGLVLALSGVVQTTAMYSARSAVVSLDPSNFKATVKSSGVYLVEFYAPWYCTRVPTCRAIAWHIVHRTVRASRF